MFLFVLGIVEARLSEPAHQVALNQTDVHDNEGEVSQNQMNNQRSEYERIVAAEAQQR